MNSTNVCPNCGPCGEVHRCLSNEKDMINQIDDNGGSTPFLDEVVKESMSYDESVSASVERNDFETSDIEKLQENSMEEIEDGLDSLRLHSFKEDPLISEGNPDSPPDEESFIEENQKDASEDNRALHENFENDLEVLLIDALYSDEPTTLPLLQGNPLDGVPFQLVSWDESRGSYQYKAKTLKSAVERERQEVGSDNFTTETGPDLRSIQKDIRVVTSKHDCRGSLLTTFPESNEHRNTSERRSMALPSDSQAAPSKKDCSGDPTSKTKKIRLKQSSTETFPRGQSGKTFSSKESHRMFHDHSYSSKEASADLPSSSQAGPSRLRSSRHSRTDSTKSPFKRSPKKSFSCDICNKKLASQTSLQTHRFLHSKDKPIICKECGKKFAIESYLKRHKRVHTGERRYKCNVCGKKFSQSCNLNTHYRLHTGDRPFKCDVCGRDFAYKSLLCRHSRSHTI